VTQDIPPYSIAAGAPAKVLRAVTYDDAQRAGGTGYGAEA
jgi:acetyltransferase-like isoleucine patch superfamily enzyme